MTETSLRRLTLDTSSVLEKIRIWGEQHVSEQRRRERLGEGLEILILDDEGLQFGGALLKILAADDSLSPEMRERFRSKGKVSS